MKSRHACTGLARFVGPSTKPNPLSCTIRSKATSAAVRSKPSPAPSAPKAKAKKVSASRPTAGKPVAPKANPPRATPPKADLPELAAMPKHEAAGPTPAGLDPFSSAEAGGGPKVIFRAPPGMKRYLYYFMGCVFTGAGTYQGFIISQHMSWPLFSRDFENNPPELVSAAPRYAAGGLIALLGGSVGMYFFWSPSRAVTRLTIYPATSQIGIRTAAPPFRAYLPKALRSKTSIPISPHDKRERLHNLASIFRRDSTSATDIADYVEGRVPRIAKAGQRSSRPVPSSILLGEDNTLGYQLEAAPHVKTQKNESKNLYKVGWGSFKMWIKGYTDWSAAPGLEGLSLEEEQARRSLHPKEPWFLDRANFDRLFPLRRLS